MWLLMITLHTIAAVVCFGAGIGALSPTRANRHGWLLPVFLGSLAGMAVFVVAAMASHWADLSGVTQAIYAGLAALALFMVYRGARAYSAVGDQDIDHGTYMDHIGFVLISLFNGFVIVAAIDLGAPGWMVGIVAVVAAVVGIQLIHRAKSREIRASAQAS